MRSTTSARASSPWSTVCTPMTKARPCRPYRPAEPEPATQFQTHITQTKIRQMDIIVQKYGGSSLAEDGQLCAVARQVSRKRESGKAVVVVVSARGKSLHRLLARSRRLDPNPELRE